MKRNIFASTRMVEDSHEVGDTLLDYDRKRNSREQRGSDSPHLRPGHILACQAGERLSSSVDVGNVVRNDGLFSYTWKTCLHLGRKTESHMNVGPKNYVPVVAVSGRWSTPANAGGDSWSDWLQPSAEGPVQGPLATESAGGRLAARGRSRCLPSCAMTTC